MFTVPFPSWLHQPGGCQQGWGMALGLEVGPRLGPLCPPLFLTACKSRSFPVSLSRYWELFCLSQVPPDKLLSLLSRDSGVLEDRCGMCPPLTARWLTVMSRA